MSSTSPKKTVHFLSLGCPKNRVDSEVMLGHMAADGYVHADAPEGADVIVVNTCAFIDAAKEESVDAILDMVKLKTAGQAGKVVVTGCLSQRYAPQLAQEIPEVDHFLGTGNFEGIADVLRNSTQHDHGPKTRASLPIFGAPQHKPKPHARLVGRNALVPYRHSAEGNLREGIPDPDFTITSRSPRVASQALFSQYLKVSEGCSNTCSFCIIPKLRGPQRSRAIADIVDEAMRLKDQGTVEINLIAQDLCAFGNDRDGDENLAKLLRELDKTGIEWIRCLYAYPKGLTEEVMEVMAGSKHIVPYLDMPLQHISDDMLRRMRRGKGGESTKDLLRKLRATVPGLVLRTTFITGLPGETDADFKELCDLVEEIRFERMGVFTFSPEEDTPAATMEGQIAPELAKERQEVLMELQRGISREQHQAMIGSRIKVLVQGVSSETELLLEGRHQGQAPEIDGVTYITSGTASPGQMVEIVIDEASDYDVAGQLADGRLD
ncbi:MAG: 30S ribosomal protein S12 methylthiotransferase RimO [Myxococcota bacterium]|nr:30S ribosomal protein S12 methylthiotransferase RimO [Myxococcota bacterium]